MEIKKLALLDMKMKELNAWGNYEERQFSLKVIDWIIDELEKLNEKELEEFENYYNILNELKELNIDVECDLDPYTRNL